MSGGRLDCLTVLSPLTAFLSLAIVSVAISTNCWLLTEEKMPNPAYNGSGDNEYLTKHTISGLWSLCQTEPGGTELACQNINYFPNEEYSPDPNDSTMAIPYAVTKSAFFFIVSTFLLFSGELCCIYGLFHRTRRIYTFVSGVIFIVSGLLMLIGLVMYISIFKAEIGGKLRPRSQLQPPQFTFEYGYSFLLYVSGFLSIETAGTCAVFLYIYWHQKDWGRKTLEMTMMNHHRKLSSSSALLPDQHIYSSGILYPCRRHPQYSQPVMTNHVSHIDRASPGQHQRRLYLEQGDSEESLPPTPKQTIGSFVGGCLGSQHDLQGISNVSSAYYAYPDETYHPSDLDPDVTAPPPPSHAGNCRPWDFPRDLTTQTVSTSADINSFENSADVSSPSQQLPDFVNFDIDDDVPPIHSPDRRSRSDFDSARRTTPV